MTTSKAIRTEQTTLNNSVEIINYVCKKWDNSKNHLESAYVIYLDYNEKVIDWELLNTGDENSCHVPVYLIMRKAVKLMAQGIVFAHNHPSGSTEPSEADIRITQNIYRRCLALDIKFIDHIIISTKCGPYSFKEQGNLQVYRNNQRKAEELFEPGSFTNIALNIVERFCQNIAKGNSTYNSNNTVTRQLEKLYIKFFDSII